MLFERCRKKKEIVGRLRQQQATVSARSAAANAVLFKHQNAQGGRLECDPDRRRESGKSTADDEDIAFGSSSQRREGGSVRLKPKAVCGIGRSRELKKREEDKAEG